MKIKHVAWFVALMSSSTLFALDGLDWEAGSRLTVGNGTNAPFLTTANAYDRYSFDPTALNTWGSVHKRTDTSKRIDVGFGLELDAQAGFRHSNDRLFDGEMYGLVKAIGFQLFAGRMRSVYGNQDPLLSSGGMIWSQNARPMHRIGLESDGYIPVPFTKGWVEVMGGLTHGWFEKETLTKHTLLHHKYAHIRIGGSGMFRLNYGLQHTAQWAGESLEFGKTEPSFSNFKRIFFGRSGDVRSSEMEQANTLGNHMISKMVGLDLQLPALKLGLYWQNLSEDPPVLRMDQAYNVEDGLWGLSMRFPKNNWLSAVVLEYLCTTDQSGPWHDLDGVIYGGVDLYYYNSVYPNGWAYEGMTLGNPWISSPRYNTDGVLFSKNSSVKMMYVSAMGSVQSVGYRLTMAHSQNYGVLTRYRYESKTQFSYAMLLDVPVKKWGPRWFMQLGLAGDIGEQYGNQHALTLGLTYKR